MRYFLNVIEILVIVHIERTPPDPGRHSFVKIKKF